METQEKGRAVKVDHIPGSHYDKRFIKEVVQAIENGLGQKQASDQYGVPKGSIAEWMRKYGSPDYQAGKKRPIPLSIRRSVIRTITAGMSIREASVVYGVAPSAIRRWKKEFLQENSELVAVNEETLSKKKTNKSQSSTNTPQDIATLQQQLADAQLKIAALNTLIDVAEEQLKIDIRKKPGARQS